MTILEEIISEKMEYRENRWSLKLINVYKRDMMIICDRSIIRERTRVVGQIIRDLFIKSYRGNVLYRQKL